MMASKFSLQRPEFLVPWSLGLLDLQPGFCQRPVNLIPNSATIQRNNFHLWEDLDVCRQEALKGQMFSTCWAHSHLHDNHSSSFRLSSLRCIDFSLAWCWLWEYLCWMFTINRRSSPAEASVWETFPNLLIFKIAWNFDMFDVLT